MTIQIRDEIKVFAGKQDINSLHVSPHKTPMGTQGKTEMVQISDLTATSYLSDPVDLTSDGIKRHESLFTRGREDTAPLPRVPAPNAHSVCNHEVSDKPKRRAFSKINSLFPSNTGDKERPRNCSTPEE